MGEINKNKEKPELARGLQYTFCGRGSPAGDRRARAKETSIKGGN